VLLVGIA
jgi:hypothetical protein